MSGRRVCPFCGRSIGTYRNGRLVGHYGHGQGSTCAGTFSLPPLVVPASVGADAGTARGAQELAAELLERPGRAGLDAA